LGLQLVIILIENNKKKKPGCLFQLLRQKEQKLINSMRNLGLDLGHCTHRFWTDFRTFHSYCLPPHEIRKGTLSWLQCALWETFDTSTCVSTCKERRKRRFPSSDSSGNYFNTEKL